MDPLSRFVTVSGVVILSETALILATCIQHARLRRKFCRHYPEVAQKESAFAHRGGKNPEVTIYFFRKRAVELLRAEPVLWRERQRFVALLTATLLFCPLSGAFSQSTLGEVKAYIAALKGKPSGPANRSQPLRSETNRTSAPAGSGR